MTDLGARVLTAGHGTAARAHPFPTTGIEVPMTSPAGRFVRFNDQELRALASVMDPYEGPFRHEDLWQELRAEMRKRGWQ